MVGLEQIRPVLDEDDLMSPQDSLVDELSNLSKRIDGQPGELQMRQSSSLGPRNGLLNEGLAQMQVRQMASPSILDSNDSELRLSDINSPRKARGMNERSEVQ